MLLKDQLADVEALIHKAGFSPVTEIPSILSRAVALLEGVPTAIQSSLPKDREPLITRLRAFQARLALFSSVMRRSEAVFQGYARHAGIVLNEYGPIGISTGARDPAFFNLSV